MLFAILFSAACIWSFQLIFTFNKTPKNFVEFAPSFGLLEIFNWGSLSGMLSCLEFSWKIHV